MMKMSNRPDVDADDDKNPLLSHNSANANNSQSYGSINATSSSSSSEYREKEDEGDNEKDQTDGSSPGQSSGQCGPAGASGWCSTLRSRDSYHRRLLLFNILAIILGVVTSLVLFLELKHAHGQCIIGMPLYEGGLLIRGVKRFWCRCPLYTIMLTSTIPWIGIMVNWVSDLFTKKCAFGKWLKWQAILTCAGTFAALSAGVTSAWGFGRWCSKVIHSLDVDDLYSDNTVTAASSVNRECLSAAVTFDAKFHDEFVKLEHTFWFTLGIMILQMLLILCWTGSCYYSVRMWLRLPKDTFLTQMLLPPGIHPRDRSSRREGGGHPSEAGPIVTDQMTTAAANSGNIPGTE